MSKNKTKPFDSFIISIFAIMSFCFFIVIFYSYYETKQFSYLYETLSSKKTHEEAFTYIYDNNLWGEGSGSGSDPKNAKEYLPVLQKFFNNPKVNSIYDLGCGDWRLMQKIDIPPSKTYYGYDVVESVVKSNTQKYSAKNISFIKINNLEDFASASGDMLIVKDVLQHWNNEKITYFLNSILPNFKFALITNDLIENRNGQTSLNIDISNGHFRPLDIKLAPFNFKKDISLLTDYEAHGNIKRVYLYTNPKYHS